MVDRAYQMFCISLATICSHNFFFAKIHAGTTKWSDAWGWWEILKEKRLDHSRDGIWTLDIRKLH